MRNGTRQVLLSYEIVTLSRDTGHCKLYKVEVNCVFKHDEYEKL